MNFYYSKRQRNAVRAQRSRPESQVQVEEEPRTPSSTPEESEGQQAPAVQEPEVQQEPEAVRESDDGTAVQQPVEEQQESDNTTAERDDPSDARKSAAKKAAAKKTAAKKTAGVKKTAANRRKAEDDA